MKQRLLESRDCNRYDMLDLKIKVLHKTAWRDKWRWDSDQYSKWLGNFKEGEDRLNAMFLLSKFMYFGNDAIRELMIRIYEDLYKRPIVYGIRKNNGNIMEPNFIEAEFKKIRSRTRFLGIGNPSESSAHLLYFFRQENRLKKNLFISPNDLCSRDEKGDVMVANLESDGIDRLVVIDDFCGSGDQAAEFHDDFVKFIKEKNRSAHIAYYALFAIEEGLERVRKLSFDAVESVYVLDESYKCFSGKSRFFVGDDRSSMGPCRIMSERYGNKISRMPLGYKDCQMLLGFNHNTPNNTLPIFWEEAKGWEPIFKRFSKIY